MAKITGSLTDFSLQSLASSSPRIIFTASGPAVSAQRLFATKPIVVIPTADTYFTVDLAPTEGLAPASWYTMRVEWLDSDGGFVGLDLIDWQLPVPVEGGVLGDLIRVPATPTTPWIGLTPPPSVTPGLWWLEMNPNDLDDPANTGYLYVWS